MTPTTPGDPVSTAPEVAAWRIRESRVRRDWSAQRLADECAALGMPSLDRSAITSIERGRRQRVGLDELFVIARALDVAPLFLLTPFDGAARMEVVPSVVVTADEARKWITGRAQLPGQDLVEYFSHQPDSEWDQESPNVELVKQLNEVVASGELASAIVMALTKAAAGVTAAQETEHPAVTEDGADDGER